MRTGEVEKWDGTSISRLAELFDLNNVKSGIVGLYNVNTGPSHLISDKAIPLSLPDCE